MSYRRPKPDKVRQKMLDEFWGTMAKLDRPAPVVRKRITYRRQQPQTKTAVLPPMPRKITKARKEGSLEKGEEV